MQSISHKPGWAAMFIFGAAMLAAPVRAQFKCTQPDGKVAYQQSPCSTDSSSKKLELRQEPVPSSAGDARSSNWSAIATGRPAVGMTIKELQGAMGSPNVSNLAQHGNDTADQLIYYKGNRTLYVYVRNGVVTSIRDRAGGETKTDAEHRRCPAPHEIKDLEFEASKIANRGNSPAARALARARACR